MTKHELLAIYEASNVKPTVCKSRSYRGDTVLHKRGAGVVGNSAIAPLSRATASSHRAAELEFAARAKADRRVDRTKWASKARARAAIKALGIRI